MYSNLNLYNPLEGFRKGNIFKSLYDPYKNYQPSSVSFKSNKEELLFNIQEIGFMKHDLNLYLDINPNDKEALELFNKYANKERELVSEYEYSYGPLDVSSSGDMTPFSWVSENWGIDL